MSLSTPDSLQTPTLTLSLWSRSRRDACMGVGIFGELRFFLCFCLWVWVEYARSGGWESLNFEIWERESLNGWWEKRGPAINLGLTRVEFVELNVCLPFKWRVQFLALDNFGRNPHRELEPLNFKGKWRGSGSLDTCPCTHPCSLEYKRSTQLNF